MCYKNHILYRCFHSTSGFFDALSVFLRTIWWTATLRCPRDNFLAHLSVPEGCSTRWVRFCGLFRYTAIRWCPGDNVLANLSEPMGLLTRWACFSEQFLCTLRCWCQRSDFVANHILYRDFQSTWGFLDPLSSFLAAVPMDSDTLHSGPNR